MIEVRDATEKDAERILEIYDYYVRNTAITFEYDTPSLEEFRERMRKIMRKYPYLVILQDGEIKGYAYAREFVGRAAYDWSCEMTIYLDHRAKKCGLGRILYETLEKALQAARLHCSGKLWCVFGCGGDRDKGKRPLMGAIAEEFADIVVVTDDNPRTEEPRAIINDILAGMLDAGQVKVMEGRAEAVTGAVMQAKANDVVLVAGKGHEDYQIVGNRRLDYSDRVTVARLLGAVA